MKKLYSKWVPRLLTVEQKQQRIHDLKRCLKLFTRNKKDFLRRYITMDETWIHHFTPKSKRASAEWRGEGESRPKRPKTAVSRQGHGLCILGHAWNFAHRLSSEGPNDQQRLLHWPHMAKKKPLFQQDNAPVHKSMKTMVKLNDLRFELPPHPPYSPDLAP